MATGLTLDTGAPIAAEKRARRFPVIWDEHLDRGGLATVPAAVVAQVWRGNSPVVARLLHACEVEVLDDDLARRVGELLARSRTSDLTGAVVVLGAVARGDAIVTSDPENIGRLLEAAGAQARVLRV